LPSAAGAAARHDARWRTSLSTFHWISYVSLTQWRGQPLHAALATALITLAWRMSISSQAGAAVTRNVLNGGCPLEKATFAGPDRNGRGAPSTAVRRIGADRQGSTLSRRSRCASGAASRRTEPK
jgi:hypothetical protein